jgi:hypothetical protein
LVWFLYPDQVQPQPFFQATGPNHKGPVDIGSVVVYKLVSTSLKDDWLKPVLASPTLSLDWSFYTMRCKVRIYLSIKIIRPWTVMTLSIATVVPFIVLGCSLSRVIHHLSSGHLVAMSLSVMWHLDALSKEGNWEGECWLTCTGTDPGW